MDETVESQVMTYVQNHLDAIPFKTLRYGEVEPTRQEKIQYMRTTLHNDPALFLSKWGRHLSQPALRLFTSIKDNYEVDFYLNSLLFNDKDSVEEQKGQQQQQQAFKKSSMRQLAQNRRYEFLQRTLRHSDYFSDENMQLRDPVLYEQFVGRHIPVQEKTKPFDNDVTLVDRIYSNMDRRYVNDRLERQKIVDEEQFEEEEEEEESDEELIERSTPTLITKSKEKEVDTEEMDTNSDTDDIEDMITYREQKRLELVKLMEEKFLAGKDVSRVCSVKKDIETECFFLYFRILIMIWWTITR